jgi:uncharacterized protein
MRVSFIQQFEAECRHKSDVLERVGCMGSTMLTWRRVFSLAYAFGCQFMVLGQADARLGDEEMTLVSKPSAPIVPGLVFTVSGGRSMVYLAGSLHFLEDGRKHPWPDALKKAYQAAHAIYFEVAPKEMNDPKVNPALLRWGRLPTGKSLWTFVSKETLTSLDTYVKSDALRDEVTTMFPWMATLVISQRQFGNQGIHLADGLESLVSKASSKDGKTIGGLEGALDHFRILSRLGADAQEELLRSSLTTEKELVEDLHKMETAWRSGDMATLDQRCAAAFAGNAELRQTLLTARNQAWAGKVALLAEQASPSLVLVGCLHLCGPDGLPSLLRARGLTVIPFSSSPQNDPQAPRGVTSSRSIQGEGKQSGRFTEPRLEYRKAKAP